MKKKSKKAKPRTKAKKPARAKARPKKAKKAAPKKKARKPAAAKKPKMSVIPPPNSILVGRVEDYFAKIGVIALTLQRELKGMVDKGLLIPEGATNKLRYRPAKKAT